jgi:hypothetical protein
MASTSFTNSSSSLITQNASIWIGVAFLDFSCQKTHAVTQVIFNESFTEAYLCYTRQHIQYGWPSEIIDAFSPSPAVLSEVIPGYSSIWTKVNYEDPSNTPIPPEYNLIIGNYLKRCCAYVQKTTIIFDSEKTCENSLLKKTVIYACKNFFPNLKSYALVFSSF